VNVYKQAQDTINGAGGIRGKRVHTGDRNIQVISADA
jgi:ABC-type branched-subunit amino acid transport system substrate-binding protein